MAVEACCDGPVVLELVEDALDPVAQLVREGAENRWINAVRSRPDICVTALICDLLAQGIAIIAPIGEQQAVFANSTQHLSCRRSVVGLPLGQFDLDREAVRIDERVDLGRKPTAGTSHATAAATFFSPFAAC